MTFSFVAIAGKGCLDMRTYVYFYSRGLLQLVILLNLWVRDAAYDPVSKVRSGCHEYCLHVFKSVRIRGIKGKSELSIV